MTTPHDAVVIGSGLGGLACAARLAMSGARVLVVERHDQLGGYASAFRRGVFDFEISLHLMDAVGLGEPHRQVLDELGVGDALTLCKPAVLRHEHWPDRELVVPHGMGAFEEVMATHFPTERAGLAALGARAADAHAEFYRAADGAAWWQGDATPSMLSPLGELARVSAAAVIDAHVADRRVRDMLALFATGWLGLPLEQLAAPQFLVPWYSYQAFGGYYPLGGSAALVRALADVVRAGGGALMTATGATRVHVERRRVHAVELADGTVVPARTVVCNASPLALRELIAPDDFDARYLARLARFEPSVSCVKLWLGLSRPRAVIDPIDYDVYLRPEIANDGVGTIDAARAGLSVVFPSSLGPEHVPAGKDVVAVSLLLDPRAWRARLAEQPSLKQDVTETLLRRVEKLVPELREMIEVQAVATPETFERFTGSPAGSIYGWHTRAGRTAGWRLSAETPISGLWLAGAWTHPGAGFTSVLRSGSALGARLAQTLEARARAI